MQNQERRIFTAVLRAVRAVTVGSLLIVSAHLFASPHPIETALDQCPVKSTSIWNAFGSVSCRQFLEKIRKAEILDLSNMDNLDSTTKVVPLIKFAPNAKFLSLREEQVLLGSWVKAWQTNRNSIRRLELRGFYNLRSLSLKGLENLESLDVTDSKQIPARLFEQCNSLRILRLKNTGFRDLSLLASCRNLRVLDVSQNGPYARPPSEVLRGLKHLRTIHSD